MQEYISNNIDETRAWAKDFAQTLTAPSASVTNYAARTPNT